MLRETLKESRSKKGPVGKSSSWLDSVDSTTAVLSMCFFVALRLFSFIESLDAMPYISLGFCVEQFICELY
jgi:hypothetical protein